MTLKARIYAIFMAVLMLTGIFCMTSVADAAAEVYGKKVFDGKDGWLFYSGDDTIEDFQGTDLYTLRELESMREKLETFRDALASQGCEFVIFIAPNKEQVYSEYMPDKYGTLTPYTRAQQVCDYLTNAGFKVVYPIAELKEAAEEHPEYDIYYRRDTHWNELGSYIGVRALLEELGIDEPPIEELSIEPRQHDSPDMSRQIGRSLKDTGYEISGFTADYGIIMDQPEDNISHSINMEADERKVLMAGDSFLVSLYYYMVQEFSEVTACFDRSLVTTKMLETIHPDIYVYEVVERYLDQLNSNYGLVAPAAWVRAAEWLSAQEEEEGEEE